MNRVVHAVHPAVVVAFESDELRFAGPAPCETEDELDDLGTGAGEADGAVFDGNGGSGHLCDFKFALELGGEDVTVSHVFCDLL